MESVILCLISDINELSLPKTCQTEFADPDDLLTFKLIISPDEVTPCHISTSAQCSDNVTHSAASYMIILHMLLNEITEKICTDLRKLL